MTWQETHQRWTVLREVEEAITRRNDGQLPWREEYAATFGDRDGLRAALRHRIEVARQAQLDPFLPEADLERAGQLLAVRHRAVLRVLQSVDATEAEPTAGRQEQLRVPA